LFYSSSCLGDFEKKMKNPERKNKMLLFGDLIVGICSGNPLKAAILINYDPTGPSRLLSTIAKQEGIDIYPVDLKQFIDFMRCGNLPTETFVLGSNQCKSLFVWFYFFCLESMICGLII
jgi:hypothetical protein